MPLFDFICKKCEKIFEVIVPLSYSKKKIKCPYCKKQLKKLMSPVYFKVR